MDVMDGIKMDRVNFVLNATNSVQENILIVSLMAYIDDMLGLDLDNVADQLEFVAKYARAKAEDRPHGR